MSTALAWVLGRGGLLGSHLARAVARRGPGLALWDAAPTGLPWKEESRLGAALEAAADSFAAAVRARGGGWAFLWAAGAGVIGTSPEALAAETRTWRRCLELLERLPANSGERAPGEIFLASSAGGVYGESTEPRLTEASACMPLSEYGRNKLRQEAALAEWNATRPDARCLVGRLSNLYGPGQNLAKPQGFISHACRNVIQGRAIQLYVPLDTIRDYLFAEDCAEHVAACVERLRAEDAVPGAPLLKVFAAEQACSLAQILGCIRRISRRHPKVVITRRPTGKEQARRIQFRSVVWPDLPMPRRTDLLVGVDRVYQHQMSLFRQGKLPAPS
ncbi:MAG: NAD(P)-dependent oxidoreductase [Planctomycetes bacterium]|nr:NAD(P)-dependent oxidoreductase [Planctomycetota bacterium]